MIVSVCVATVACAPRWRRLGFNDCKGSGFSEKHQTAKGKVTSHAQPKRPSIQPQACPAPAIPEPRAPSMPKHPASPTPFESQTHPPCERKALPKSPLQKENPPTPRKPFSGAYLRPPRTAKNRQEPAKNPPPKSQRSALPSKEERSKISIGPHRLSGSAKHLGYLSNLRALKQA